MEGSLDWKGEFQSFLDVFSELSQRSVFEFAGVEFTIFYVITIILVFIMLIGLIKFMRGR